MKVSNSQTNMSTWPTTVSTGPIAVSVWPKIIKPATDNHSFNNEQDYPFTPSLSKGYED